MNSYSIIIRDIFSQRACSNSSNVTSHDTKLLKLASFKSGYEKCLVVVHDPGNLKHLRS